MTPEEFQRLKEAEKEHLRKLKEIKHAGRALGRQQSLTRAIEEITGAGDDALGTREEMLDRLNTEAARGEARLEIALDAAAEREAEARRAAEMAKLEEEARQARAGSLVAQMKRKMGLAADTPRPAAPPSTKPAGEQPRTPAADAPENPPGSPGGRPEKTIGRM